MTRGLRERYDAPGAAVLIQAAAVRPVFALPPTPILPIHGASDNRIPYSDSVRLAAAHRASSLWLVPHAGHTAAYAAAPDEFRRRVLEWFAAH